MNVDLTLLKNQTTHIATELLEMAKMSPGQILVVGCSTSEVIGATIGSAGSTSVAEVILDSLRQVCSQNDIYLAVQCCEHLNRALVIEEEAARTYHLDQVMVVPIPKAGGALGAQAMSDFNQPVVVENICAHAGLDIGGTMIGMHLKAVAVPLRLTHKMIGQAFVIAARTRPKLIGGPRAVYNN
ncbi:TIGR01440 family protein [Pelosinus sp. sgz500959]|uniref:TIGR01440 family protein n=1 Tax=Pelosinus sp. sgz500959 TaxID=3242472 RepID=UPI00367190DE